MDECTHVVELPRPTKLELGYESSENRKSLFRLLPIDPSLTLPHQLAPTLAVMASSFCYLFVPDGVQTQTCTVSPLSIRTKAFFSTGVRRDAE